MIKSKKIIAMVLAVAISLGTIVGTNTIQGKANEVVNAEKCKSIDADKTLDYSKLIKKFRNDDVIDIRITSLEELYEELNKHTDITEDKTRELLNASSDEVIEEYISSEVVKALNIFQGEQGAYKIDENEVIEEDDESYVRKNDTKQEKTIVTKYGTKIITERIDETESPTRLNWVKTPVHWGERNVKKAFGDRRFTHSVKVKILSINIVHFWVRLRYNVSKNGLEVNEVLGDLEWIAESVMNFEVDEKNINKKHAKKYGEEIEADIIFKFEALRVLPMAVRYKYVLNAKLGRISEGDKCVYVDHDVQEWVDFKL